MRQISTTVTVGEGSEKHNHDLEYRDTLEHVHSRPNGVIELIPYKDYREQINELVRPYIDEYNAKVEQRYLEAWDRFNRGEIKTKPRKANFKKMGYDYYNDHLHDTYFDRKNGKHEELPMWRSVIIGLGDRADRQDGLITEAEAVKVLENVVDRFQEEFPDFHLLGASLHLDEEGFYHVHMDYKPLYEHDCGQGLNINIGQESALEHMGLEPEQSIINGRDKVPLRFNAFRNKIYHTVEKELAKVGIRLQYGVSKTKEPEKDSSKNQKLEEWQATQDAVREMQKQKNVALDLMEKDDITPNEIKAAIKCVENIKTITEQIDNSPRGRWNNKENVMVHYKLFDQLKQFLQPLYVAVSVIVGQIKRLTDRNKELEDENAELKENAEKTVSKFEYNMLRARHERELEDERQKNRNLAKRLREDGYTERGIKNIEQGQDRSFEKTFRE